MTKFVTVQMFLVQNERRDSKATLETVPGFLAWKNGYKVKNKNSHGADTWTIKKIDDHRDGAVAISYQATVELVNDEETETKVLRGSTLQSGYVFVSGTEEVEQKRTTKPMTFEADALARFYARKHNRLGTRLMFKDKTNYIVADSYEDILTQIQDTPQEGVRVHRIALRDGAVGEQVD